MEGSRACRFHFSLCVCFFQGLTDWNVSVKVSSHKHLLHQREREKEREMSTWGRCPRNVSSSGVLYRYLHLWVRYLAVRPWLRIHPCYTSFCQEPGIQKNVNLFFFQLFLLILKFSSIIFSISKISFCALFYLTHSSSEF